jgi:calcium-dependent protein kinase
MVGTPFYMAPEIFNGCYDISCDNWSLGCILYFLLSGDTPFRGYDIK